MKPTLMGRDRSATLTAESPSLPMATRADSAAELVRANRLAAREAAAAVLGGPICAVPIPRLRAPSPPAARAPEAAAPDASEGAGSRGDGASEAEPRGPALAHDDVAAASISEAPDATAEADAGDIGDGDGDRMQVDGDGETHGDAVAPADQMPSQETQPAEEASEAADDDDDLGGGVCRGCGDADWVEGNELLLCDGEGCDAAYHLQCLPRPLAAPPVGDWYCPDCEVRWSAADELDMPLAAGLALWAQASYLDLPNLPPPKPKHVPSGVRRISRACGARPRW